MARGNNVVLWVALMVGSVMLQLRTTVASSVLSVPFLEMGTSSAVLTGILSQGDDSNSDPISISLSSSSSVSSGSLSNETEDVGLPFSNGTESLVYVNVNGFLSFRMPRDYSAPENLFFDYSSSSSSFSSYPHLIAPYWTHHLSLGGQVRYEVHNNGGSILNHVNSLVSQEVGVAFEGVWLLLVHWDNIPSAADPTKRDSYQAALVTDGARTYVLFLYQCGLLQSSRALIGFSASGNFSTDHRWSLTDRSSEVACLNSPHSNWSSLLYSVHYDGIKSVIRTSPEGPVYQAGVSIIHQCRAVTPGAFTFQWEAWCNGARIYQSSIHNDVTNVITIASTPDFCLDVVMCKVWDDATGSFAETSFTASNITGVGFLQMANNSGIEANSTHKLGVVSCHSALTTPHIGRWVDPDGVEIPASGDPIFDIQFHTTTYHSYTTLSVKQGSEFRAASNGVYSCIIPDETGTERTLFVGLYDNTFNPVPSSHPLTLKRTSENPFTLTCTSTHLPPTALSWTQNDTTIQANSSFSLSTHLVDRHNSSFSHSLVVATGNNLVGTNYRCGVNGRVVRANGGLSADLSHFSYAAVQEVGGHWSLKCHPPQFPAGTDFSTVRLTWETAGDVVLSEATGGAGVEYKESVVDAHHNSLIACYLTIGDTKHSSLHVTLIVQVPGTPLDVTVASDPVKPEVGQPLKLTCKSSKSLQTGLTNHTTATWSHDSGNDIIMEGNMIQTETLTFRDLMIMELRTSHAGVYNCTGQLTTVAKDNLLIKTVHHILTLSIPMATVKLTTPTREVNFKSGSSATLVCTATLPSYVDTEVTGVVAWETPNGPLDKTEGKFHLSVSRTGNHTHQFMLNISDLQPEDKGGYRCSVQFSSSTPSSYLLPSTPASSEHLVISLDDNEPATTEVQRSSQSPETTPTNPPPTIDGHTTILQQQSSTPGVIGSIVAIAIIAIVVVAIAIIVVYFALRRKPNTQIHNMDSEYAKGNSYTHSASSLPPPFFQSYSHHSPANFHDDDLYTTLDSPPPPPLPPARTSVPPDEIPAYADSNTVIPPDHIPPYPDSNTYSDPDTLCTNSTDSTSVDDDSDEKGQSSSQHRLETANPLYASANDLDGTYSKITMATTDTVPTP